MRRRWSDAAYGLLLIVLAAGLIALGLKVYSDQSRTQEALCTFRTDLQQRVASTTKFLKDNPQGFPGVPLRVLQTNLHNQMATVESLMSLHC